MHRLAPDPKVYPVGEGHRKRPESVVEPGGAARSDRQRVAGTFIPAADRRGHLRELIEIVEYDWFGGRPRHGFAAAEFVPDFAVMVAGGFEQAGAGMGGVPHLDLG